jgi:hypothetical protein
MLLLARALVRIVAFALLALLAVAGLLAAIFCIQGGTGTLSLTRLAEVAGLPELRDEAGTLLGALEAPGPLAVASALAGLAAMLAGLVLLAGVLVPRRERLVGLPRESGEGNGTPGTLDARRRALAQVAVALAEQAQGVTGATARARSRRRGGGRLRVTATRTAPSDDDDVADAVTERLAELTGPFALEARVRTRAGERGSRVQ